MKRIQRLPIGLVFLFIFVIGVLVGVGAPSLISRFSSDPGKMPENRVKTGGFTAVGTVLSARPGISMQGGHMLIADDKKTYILINNAINFFYWEGRRVGVTGSVRQAVETGGPADLVIDVTDIFPVSSSEGVDGCPAGQLYARQVLGGWERTNSSDTNGQCISQELLDLGAGIENKGSRRGDAEIPENNMPQ